MIEKKVYSLSNLTQSIQKVINQYCNKTVWIKAEIVKLNYYPKSGHCYPTLVEKKGGRVIAELRGNIWAAQFEMINKKFHTVLREELRDNMTVVIQGSVTYHPLHGLALNITDIDPEYTLGELAREKAETIARLKETGIYAKNKQTRLDTLPKTIAIISVETSKGYGDFMDVIKKNPWGYQFHFLLFPAILQGERAVATINEQLERIKVHAGVFDAVAIIRGGGGEIGLSCFDSFLLAEKIATFPIPVLTGIGHATNETVSELVSYESFITPTKIAEFLLQKFHDYATPLKEGEEKLAAGFKRIIQDHKTNLKDTARLFSSLTGRSLDNASANLNRLVYQLEQLSLHNLREQRNILIRMQQSLLAGAVKPVEEEQKRLTFTGEKIEMLSPQNILKRGYSITRHNGKIIEDTDGLQPGSMLETQLNSGRIYSRIEQLQKSTEDE